MIQFLFLVLGFVALIFGADKLVDGASVIARRLKVSDLIIGLTIVAFGTSFPEFKVKKLGLVSGWGKRKNFSSVPKPEGVREKDGLTESEKERELRMCLSGKER